MTSVALHARHLGTDVAGVCSARNLDPVASLGASHVVDYKTEDFTQSGRHYDVILDTVGAVSYGNKSSWGAALTVLGWQQSGAEPTK